MDVVEVLLTLVALVLLAVLMAGMRRRRLRRAAVPGVPAILAVGWVLAVAGGIHAAGAGTIDQLVDEGLDAVSIGHANHLRETDGRRTTDPAGFRTAGQAPPMSRAHAHNDYEHEWPLLDALARGFTSVEADVWLVDGDLMVAHDRQDVVAGRSLERLYLSPLEVFSRMNGGTVYPDWDGSLELLIDVKSAAGPTYAALQRVLSRHSGLLTTFTGGHTDRRSVTAVISGNQDRTAMLAPDTRYAGYDGRLGDLDSGVPTSVMPLVSSDWTDTFAWDGTGEMPVAEEQRLHDIVNTAHDHGYRVRFWATPDQPGSARDAVWRELVDVGVDEISTDDLAGLQRFLTG